MNRTLFLSIVTDYAAHWGFWEAMREILQNAYDQCDRDPMCELEFDYDKEFGRIKVRTTTGALTAKSLLLGCTDKADDAKMRGKFGEGYKLAMLVLCRLHHGVTVINNDERWVPAIKYNFEYDADVLSIEISDALEYASEGVTFYVHNVNPADWAGIQRNICHERKADVILPASSEKGRIYVGGLYVATLKDYAYGYAFAASSISLDRDRGMVHDFDVACLTSKMWSKHGGDEATRLLRDNAADTKYCASYSSSSSPVTTHSYGWFRSTHGPNAVPVTSQSEIEKATAAGVKWVLVPQVLKDVLSAVTSFFIPSKATPVERLKKLLKKNKAWMSSEDIEELEDIIKVMS